MKLRLIVHKAVKLANKDLIGKSDPYVVVAYGDKKFKSKPVKNNLNPVWDHKVVFDLNDKPASKIRLSVFDEDIGKDDLMGSVDIDVEDIKKSKTANNSKVDLTGCKSGQIIFSYELNPTEDVTATVADVVVKTTKDDIKEDQPAKPGKTEAKEKEQPETKTEVIEKHPLPAEVKIKEDTSDKITDVKVSSAEEI